MTVTSTDRKIVQAADGLQKVFPYNFVVFDPAHLFVFENDVITVKPFTVQGVGIAAGGTITFTGAAPAAGSLAIVRTVPLTQLVDYAPFDAFPAETHERALDLSVQRDQQSEEATARSLRIPVTDAAGIGVEYPPAAARADQTQTFDSGGNVALANLSAADLEEIKNVVLGGDTPPATILNIAYILLEDQKANGVTGGTNVAEAWTTRDLNTIAFDIQNLLVSLVANEFTLAPGVYRIDVRSPFFRTSGVNTRLFDVTNAVPVPEMSAATWTDGGASDAQVDSILKTVVTISETTTYRVEYLADDARASNGLGVASGATNWDGVEVYTQVEIFTELLGAFVQADQISYNNVSSGLTAVEVQAAIDELEARLAILEP